MVRVNGLDVCVPAVDAALNVRWATHPVASIEAAPTLPLAALLQPQSEVGIAHRRGCRAASHACYFDRTFDSTETVEVVSMATEDSPKRIGRPPLPEGEARTSTLRTMVRPETAEEFRQAADQEGVSVSEALLEAALDWVKKRSR